LHGAVVELAREAEPLILLRLREGTSGVGELRLQPLAFADVLHDRDAALGLPSDARSTETARAIQTTSASAPT
jgi:hypothetical protein